MVTISFDPDARTLYWYFSEIEAGSTAFEGECDGTLLLDADGQVIGLELEFDGIGRRELALALAHPHVRFDRGAATLTVLLLGEEPAEVQPLHEPVILDFDAGDQLQGCEVFAAPEFGLGERLGRLDALRVALEDDEPPPGWGDDTPDDEPSDTDDEPADDEPGEHLDEALDEALAEDDDELAELDALDALAEDDELAELDALDGAPASQVAEDEPQDRQPEPPQTAALAPEGFRSGFVALVGKPNVGKSTLLNALLGQKVAIVSPKPQTTRMPLRGILSRSDAQIVFVDTPGIHDPRTKLGSFMVEQARRSIPDADVVCFVVDIAEPPNRTERRIAELTARSRARRILVLNKVDRRTGTGQQHLAAYRALGPWDMEVAVSALRAQGLETLLGEIVARLPAGPALYPDDQVTDQSEREHAAELVREQVLKLTEQEVPHGVAVEVEEWEEKEHAVYIRMTIYVEKESQKGILIGANGAMLKRIGSGARPGIEELAGRRIFLDLWVKARPNWRDDPSSLRWLGYRDRD